MNAATAEEFEPPPTTFIAFVVALFRVVCIFDLNASIMGLNNDIEPVQFCELVLIEYRFHCCMFGEIVAVVVVVLLVALLS